MERIDCSSLVLLGDGGGELSDIADLLVGELVKYDGLKYHEVTMTMPLRVRIPLASRLTVFDKTKKQQLFQFVVERVTTNLEREQFLKVEGKIYVAFPKNP